MRYRIDYDKKRMKKVEKLLIVCFCKSLVDFFVIRYNYRRNKNRRRERRRWYGFVHKENIESDNHICNFSCYIRCSVSDSVYA